jgi:Xaa-Pro dipeptidase
MTQAIDDLRPGLIDYNAQTSVGAGPAVRRNAATHRARLARALADRGLDAVAVSSYQAVSYFAGTHILTQETVPDRLAFLVVFADGSSAMVVCSIETAMVRQQTDVGAVHEYVEFADHPTDPLAQLLSERLRAGARVGVEARRLSVETSRALLERLPGLDLVAIDDDVESLQTVKLPDEALELAGAAQSTVAAIEKATAAPHATEAELCAHVAARIIRDGGVLSFLMFGAGARTTDAHPVPTTAPFREGDVWRIDVGARFLEVVNSDVARCGVIGAPSARQDEMLRALRATQDAGIAAIEPGRPACEVYQAVKREYERQGIPFPMPHVGHGLGVGLHEHPMLEPRNETPLAAGMVLNVEPILLLPEHGEAYHIEDLVVVTDEGARLLTAPQDALIQVAP